MESKFFNIMGAIATIAACMVLGGIVALIFKLAGVF